MIIAPTRELVMQIAADAAELGRFTGLKTVTSLAVPGYQKQLNKVNQAPVDLIVATPWPPDRLFWSGVTWHWIGWKRWFWTKRIACWTWGLFRRSSALSAPRPARKIDRPCFLGHLYSRHHESGQTVDLRAHHR
ncbi:MAG: hypothetical protein CM15mP89_0210 [Gammaproteobacteria bacterium]|nr:MAG: hypothetical protein CM15mP89_0210 [Gammaproteobacteria bacterium]